MGGICAVAHSLWLQLMCCHSASSERGHGGGDASHILHPAGVDAQGDALCPVRPPGAGLRPAAGPCRLPNPEQSRCWPECGPG